MKKLLVILVLALIVLSACERKSGYLSQSGKRSAEMKTETKNDFRMPSENITVVVVSSPVEVTVDRSVSKFKTKVMIVSDSTYCYVLLNNMFNIGDKISVKPTQQVVN